MKKFISIMLILSTLLSLTIICNATLIADQLIDIPAEEEIMPMCSSGCHGTPAHQKAIDDFIASYPNATRYYINKSLSKAELSGSWRPDAIVFSGGMIYIHEVVSPSQTVKQIEDKINDMKYDNKAENIVWSYQTIGGPIIYV
jgi:hypothetical protein